MKKTDERHLKYLNSIQKPQKNVFTTIQRDQRSMCTHMYVMYYGVLIED